MLAAYFERQELYDNDVSAVATPWTAVDEWEYKVNGSFGDIVAFAGEVSQQTGENGGFASAEMGVLAQFAGPPQVGGVPVGGAVFIPTVEAAAQVALVANANGLGIPVWAGPRSGGAAVRGLFQIAPNLAPNVNLDLHATIFVAAYGATVLTGDASDLLNPVIRAELGGYAEVRAEYDSSDSSWDVFISTPDGYDEIYDLPGVEEYINVTIPVSAGADIDFYASIQHYLDDRVGISEYFAGSVDSQWETVAAAWGYLTETGQDLSPGDVDGDGDVDEDDLQIINDNFNWEPFPGGGVINGPATRVKGDLNQDGEINQADVNIWAADAPSDLILVSTELDENDLDHSLGDLSLREALGLADDGDKIVFAPGVNELTLGGTQLTVADDITIFGPGVDKLTIDANDASRIFAVSAGVEATINGMTITGGQVTAPTHGGAIRNDGDLTLDSVVVTDNHASYIGGAIYSVGSAKLHIKDSTFTLNSAGSTGGAIYSDSAQVDALVIERSTFFDNEANNAGAIYLSGDDGLTGTVTISNSTFSGNRALTTSGGAIKNAASAPPVTIINSTIAYNTSVTGGGGIDMHNNSDNRFTLHNTILAHNDATSATTDNLNRAVNSASSYNLIGYGGTSGLTNGIAGNILLGTGVSARLAPLDYYGGKTKTHALYYDSLAINNGDDTIADTWSETDQRGYDRIVDWDLGTGVDIGAFELALDELYSD